MVIVFEIFKMFLKLLKVPIFIICVSIFTFYILIGLNVLIELIKGKRFKKSRRRTVKRKSFLRRILIDFPHRIALDLFNRDFDEFGYQGLIIFEGRQGRGKTIAMVEFARRMQEEYPDVKCITNLDYKGQDDELDHWSKLVHYSNGKFGVIGVIDETQNWFSSNQSKDFPPEMLQTITQNRKNRRIILGTSQNFYLLAKAIRSQATEVRRCSTLFGCLTIVRRVVPILDSSGNVVEWKKRGMYFFVHDDDLRKSYDTYHVIESLSDSGFQPRTQDTTNVTNVLIQGKK